MQAFQANLVLIGQLMQACVQQEITTVDVFHTRNLDLTVFLHLLAFVSTTAPCHANMDVASLQAACRNSQCLHNNSDMETVQMQCDVCSFKFVRQHIASCDTTGFCADYLSAINCSIGTSMREARFLRHENLFFLPLGCVLCFYFMLRVEAK